MCGPSPPEPAGPPHPAPLAPERPLARPSRRQVLLAGAVAPLLPRLPRGVPAVALGPIDVLPRSAWGAGLPPKKPLSLEAAGDVRFLLVHHTASTNNYTEGEVPDLLRGFYGFHTSSTKGWPDLAYNFMVDRFGRVWEGRTGSLDGPVKGDATGGSQGFALLSCFIGDHTREPPSAAALDAMGKLLGTLASRHGIDVRPGTKTTFVSRGSNLHPAGKSVTTPTIAGHRDMSKTSCPGDACYRLVPTRLVPAAVAAAGAAATPRPATAPAPEPTAAPTSLPGAATELPTTPGTAPGETLPPANPGGVPLDTTPAPTVAPPLSELVGTGGQSADGRPDPVVAGAAAGGVAVAGLVALVLRRRARLREAGHWENARSRDEPA